MSISAESRRATTGSNAFVHLDADLARRGGRRGRRRGRARRGSRPARGRALRREGPRALHRNADHVRVRSVLGPRPRSEGQSQRRPPSVSRRGTRRQDGQPGVRHAQLHEDEGLRHHPQPVGRHQDPRRLERRLVRCGGGWHHPLRDGVGRRRLDPHPRVVHWARRPQAQPRAHPASGTHVEPDERQRLVDHDRRRHGTDPRRARRPRRPRPHVASPVRHSLRGRHRVHRRERPTGTVVAGLWLRRRRSGSGRDRRGGGARSGRRGRAGAGREADRADRSDSGLAHDRRTVDVARHRTGDVACVCRRLHVVRTAVAGADRRHDAEEVRRAASKRGSNSSTTVLASSKRSTSCCRPPPPCRRSPPRGRPRQ